MAIKTFSRRRSHRCDENRVFFVQIGAILASIRPFEVFPAVLIFMPGTGCGAEGSQLLGNPARTLGSGPFVMSVLALT